MIYGSPKEIVKRIGAHLKRCRLEQNITQQQLADRCDISISSIKNIENGKGPTLETFLLVTRALNKDGWVSAFEPDSRISPLVYAEVLMKDRKRHQRLRARQMKGG